MVFQETALFPWMTTAKNVLYGPQARGEANAATKILADFLLDKVGLRAFRDRYPAQLSGGMQRRAELARALINNPDVMILDEPFRGLDAMTKKLMLEYFAKLCEDAKAHQFLRHDRHRRSHLPCRPADRHEPSCRPKCRL